MGVAVKSHYARFADDELILRDVLAVDRTLLANERTLLAYLRSAVALIIAGVSIIHFSEQIWFLVVGIVCLPGGLATALIGMVRFKRLARAMSCVRGKAATPTRGGKETP